VYPRDTIAAIATPAGVGAVAVIRVSGPGSSEVATRVFRGRSPERWQSHRLYLGRFVDGEGRELDRGLAVIMRSPHSYTGEDVLELHSHGGSLVARRILGAVLCAGARCARPGEFTARALLNGKLDLTQAESVADVVGAPTDAALRVAVEQLGGALSQWVGGMRERLINVSAHLEAVIDFSEDDVGELDRAALVVDTASIERALLDLAATHAHGRILREGLRVAIVGKPNVGKSSLLNHLLQTERAIVTPIPGTTRDTLEETLDLDGIPVVLVDTAGIRGAAAEVERLGIERTRQQIEGADLVIVMLDGSRPFDAEDQKVLDAVRHKARISLINKVDLPRELVVEEARLSPTISTSLLDGRGIDSLKREIVATGLSRPVSNEGIVILRERQRSALELAASAVGRARRSLAAGHPPDVIALDVMTALDHLGDVVGRTSPEDVLDRIFSEFCIGK
jgi:tRNA modification GTPase